MRSIRVTSCGERDTFYVPSWPHSFGRHSANTDGPVCGGQACIPWLGSIIRMRVISRLREKCPNWSSSPGRCTVVYNICISFPPYSTENIMWTVFINLVIFILRYIISILSHFLFFSYLFSSEKDKDNLIYNPFFSIASPKNSKPHVVLSQDNGKLVITLR